MRTRFRSERGSRPSLPALLPGPLLALALCACGLTGREAAPAPALDAVARARRDPSPDELRTAWALAGSSPLGLRPDLDAPPEAAAYWQARALAHAAEVRAARRAWRELREARSAAGLPLRPVAGARTPDLGDPAPMGDLLLTIDLLGVLGLGPYAADREVAARTVGLARGRLEQAAWRAWHEAARAWWRVRSTRRQLAGLDAVLASARPALERLRLLREAGRLGEGPLGMASAAFARVALQRRQLLAEEASRVARLARVCGLAPGAPSLARVPAGPLPAPSPVAPAGEKAELVGRRPDLRAARAAYALAEARVRAAAARAWPGIRLTPQVRPDRWLLGGFLQVDLPWPARVRARIAAASESRAAAREALEDAWIAALNECAERRVVAVNARREAEREAREAAEAARRAWRAASARLLVREGPEVIEPWSAMLGNLAAGERALVQARERAALARIDLREALGSADAVLGDGTDDEGKRP